MKFWNVPAPGPDESMILQAVGTAMLFPSDSGHWRSVFGWCERHRQHPISKTILEGFAGQGGDIDEAFELGDDPGQQRTEPLWLSRALTTAAPGDTESNLREALEKRRRAAHRRAVERWEDARS